MAVTETNLPTRLTQALEQLTQLNKLGIQLLPVRHHSPACAYATQQALTEINPTHILIEGPASFNELLSDLQHVDNKPPLAVLCQTELSYQLQIEENDEDTEKDNNDSPEQNIDRNTDKNTATQADKTTQYETIKQLRSAYFPFCDYSPEWVALQFPIKHQQNSSKNNNTKNSTQNHAQVQFIDLPWSQQVAHDTQVSQTQDIEAKSLQQERYLAHSHYIKRLAEKLHCRDHDDVWEYLFELDGKHTLADWRGFFKKVLVWCAMSRLDYEASVLEAESSLVREAHMVERIVACYQGNKKTPMVIVTGGFHTLALIEQLYDKLIQKNTKKTKTTKTVKTDKQLSNTAQQSQSDIKNIQTSTDQSWLIRYSFDRLDALNGYASGMPSPAFYQACWQDFFRQETTKQSLQKQTHTNNDNNNDLDDSDKTQRESLVIDFLSEFSRQLRHEQIIQSSFITVKTASEQAIRLAELRGHRLIGRYDVIDACHSSFLKDSTDNGYHAFHQLLQQKLSGSALGQVVSTTRTPPLLAQVHALVQKQRFKLDDTLSKTTKLDVLRKPTHRDRSTLLHLLAFLNINFARRLQGPDFLRGSQLHLLFEEWTYAWTPQVEADLIELSEQGTDIYQLATARLLQQKQKFEEEGQNQSSAEVVRLLIQASMMGLTEHASLLFQEMQQTLPQDPDLQSVLACGEHLMYLWTGRRFLKLGTDKNKIRANSNSENNSPKNNSQKNNNLANNDLLTLITALPATALFLLSQITTPNEDQVQTVLHQVIALRNLLKQISSIDKQALPDISENGSDNKYTEDDDLLADFHTMLNRLLPSWQSLDVLVGAVHALAFTDGMMDENDFANALQQHFGMGAEAQSAVAYLSGVMHAVPTLFLHYQGMTTMLNALVNNWNEETFIALLPDLRLAFTKLKPMQTNELAQQVADIHGVDATQVTQYQASLSEEDMMQGLQLNQQLEKVLLGRGLGRWIDNTSNKDFNNNSNSHSNNNSKKHSDNNPYNQLQGGSE